eukprot:424870_1
MSSETTCKDICESCCKYNWKRFNYYLFLPFCTIGIMAVVDYFALLNTNTCLNTYSILAQILNPTGSYQYMCYQDEIDYALAVAFILMVTFHALFAIFIFHVVQAVYFKKYGRSFVDKSNESSESDKRNKSYRHPYQPASPFEQNERVPGINTGRSSDNTLSDDDLSNESDQILHPQKAKKKQTRKNKNKRYGGLPTSG